MAMTIDGHGLRSGCDGSHILARWLQLLSFYRRRSLRRRSHPWKPAVLLAPDAEWSARCQRRCRFIVVSTADAELRARPRLGVYLPWRGPRSLPGPLFPESRFEGIPNW